jgi:hypothetical protein
VFTTVSFQSVADDIDCERPSNPGPDRAVSDTVADEVRATARDLVQRFVIPKVASRRPSVLPVDEYPSLRPVAR